MKNIFKIFFLFFLTFSCGYLYSQKVILYLFGIDCNNKIDTTLAVLFDNQGNTYGDNLSEMAMVYQKYHDSRILLPDTGTYYLSENDNYDNRFNPTKNIHITKFGVNNDTILIQKLQENYLVSTPVITQYSYCGKNCNGKMIDYFENGKKRIEGFFADGFLVDTLKKYHLEGGIREMLIRNKNSKKQYLYYKTGLLKEENIEKPNRYYRYAIRFSKKYYFENGNVRIIENYDNKGIIERRYEYFENSKKLKEKRTKHRLIYFSESGIINEKIIIREDFRSFFEDFCFDRLYIWKKWSPCINHREYSINYYKYDNIGKLKIKAKLEKYGSDIYFFPKKIGDADWIEKYREYDGSGKIIRELNNVEIEKLLNENH